ncbi:Por secretion system C-terminal sorting domain-containing protein [Mariniphaga anaerophila]|uniref:N-acetylmuramoyl-L-alanine amidase n=1 Tax=Mariniphaga anaerophila TaxID=1484053 RepID=A0A1M4SN08_9BACT|nr:Ig-like domain-containing protein [Mariniphaga anaerophila]SHE33558.1 Por secretion system C-terminal sorting domain-containing protein [Mariniphaga anaerophila]
MKKYLIPSLFFGLLFFLNGYGQNLEGVKIYVNPGHGGYNSDDRNVPIKPFALGDTAGFWESKSNLAKGLHLRMLLENAGAEVIMSRVQNRTEDDRPLSAIAEEANANQVDFMISIHSNAFNSVTNYVLQLFHGWDNNPILPASMDVANLFWERLISNQTSHWTNSNRIVRGDKSFAPENWNGYGVLRPLTVPGLISEGSFHDYIPETYRLMNREYKHLEAWHFYRAFLDYFGEGKDSNGKIAGFVKDDFRKVTEYYTTAGSTDAWLPVNKAKITLQPGNNEYTTDSLNNGFFLFDNLEPGIYQLKIEAEKYSTKVIDNIVVKPDTVTYQLCYVEQDRSDPMQVLDYSPKVESGERVSAATSVVFHFNFEVDHESFENAFSISPEVEGTFSYENQERSAVFTPNAPLATSTLYTVTLDKSVKHIGGLSMENDVAFSFLTALKNRLSVLDIYPRNGMENVYENTQMRIHFDGRLVEENLTTLIHVEDSEGKILNRAGIEVNAFPGDVGSYAFSPSGLEPGSSYTLKLSAGLTDGDGLQLQNDEDITFTVGPVDEPDATVALDFEQSALSWAVDLQNSFNIVEGAGNRILRYSSNQLFGSYSYRLLYEFAKPEAHVVVRPPETLFSVTSSSYAGLYIWGNLSNNEIVLLFEKDGTEYEIPLTVVDFAGWQFRTCQLNFSEENGQYNFAGFKLISGQTSFSDKGIIIFDNLLVSDDFSTSAIEIVKQSDDFRIFPNPATNQVQIELEKAEGTFPYTIYDLQGKTVQSGTLDFSRGLAKIYLKFPQTGLFVLTVNQKNNRKESKLLRE